MKITDEILNRYIDGELNKAEMEEFKVELATNDEAAGQLNDMQTVHSSLYKIETIPAPANITIDVMKKILKKSDKFIKDKNFFRFVSIVFGIFTTTLIVLGLTSSEKPAASAYPWMEQIVISVKGMIPQFSISLNSTYVLIIGISFGVLLSISILFLYETHKRFNKKINSF
jgi:hypothetical protein